MTTLAARSALAALAALFFVHAPAGAEDEPEPVASGAAEQPASRIEATMEARREGERGPLGEHDVQLVLRLRNGGGPGTEVTSGNLLLRSDGGWLTPLDPTSLAGTFARGARFSEGEELRVEPPVYKVLGPALDLVLALEATDGVLVTAAPWTEPEAQPATVPAPARPISLGVHGPLEAVPYADGHRSIVVIGQLQLLTAGALTEVHGSLVVGGDQGTTPPQTWTGGVGDGAGPALWPFVQRVDVGNDFVPGAVSLRVKAKLDGRDVEAALDLPVERVEPFRCDGPVLGAWHLANGPAERQLHANSLQLRSRYAWDFVIMEDGRTHAGDVTDNDAYYAFGRSVRAVADGTVVDRCDHQPDRSGGSTPAAPCVHTPVNRIVLRHDDGSYTAYLHLKKDSIPQRLQKDSRVAAGQVIAKVGNSGASSEPHLQFFAFRLTPEPGRAAPRFRPLPVAFANAFEDAKGTRPVDGVPVGGTQVHFLERR
jgi:hypothetical protein